MPKFDVAQNRDILCKRFLSKLTAEKGYDSDQSAEQLSYKGIHKYIFTFQPGEETTDCGVTEKMNREQPFPVHYNTRSRGHLQGTRFKYTAYC